MVALKASMEVLLAEQHTVSREAMDNIRPDAVGLAGGGVNIVCASGVCLFVVLADAVPSNCFLGRSAGVTMLQ